MKYLSLHLLDATQEFAAAGFSAAFRDFIALAFLVLPEVFFQMRGGALVGAAFFVLLSIAALTSAVSLFEVPVAEGVSR